MFYEKIPELCTRNREETETGVREKETGVRESRGAQYGVGDDTWRPVLYYTIGLEVSLSRICLEPNNNISF